MTTVTTDVNFDITGSVNPQFSIIAVEASASQVVGSLPLDEFDAPVYDRVHQKQIGAGMTVQHRDENLAVQEHVIVQEIPQVPIAERTQEQIVDITGLVNPPFFFTGVGLYVTGRWFTSSFWRVWCARVQPNSSGTDHCWGDNPEHTWEPSCARQMVVQEIPQAPQVVDSSPLLGDVAAREHNQILQPLVIFHEKSRGSGCGFTDGSQYELHVDQQQCAWRSCCHWWLSYSSDSGRRTDAWLSSTNRPVWEWLHGTRSKLLLSSSASLVQSLPVTSVCCKSRLMSIMPLSCKSVNSCKLSRKSWLLSCGRCKRSANVLLMIAWTRRCLLLHHLGERRKAGTQNELWTVYELATARLGRFTNTVHMVKSYGEPMLPTYVVERFYDLEYIIHMCTETCTAGADSRILRFADTWLRRPATGRHWLAHSRFYTEGQPEFRALHRSGRLFDDFLHDDANISFVAGWLRFFTRISLKIGPRIQFWLIWQPSPLRIDGWTASVSRTGPMFSCYSRCLLRFFIFYVEVERVKNSACSDLWERVLTRSFAVLLPWIVNVHLTPSFIRHFTCLLRHWDHIESYELPDGNIITRFVVQKCVSS